MNMSIIPIFIFLFGVILLVAVSGYLLWRWWSDRPDFRIIIDWIPSSKQRYPTAGDWYYSAAGNLCIKVSSDGPESLDETFAIAVHELIEAYLCEKDGVAQHEVDRFDLMFEAEREAGMHSLSAEPGDDPRAPYRRQHEFATGIEARVLERLTR